MRALFMLYKNILVGLCLGVILLSAPALAMAQTNTGQPANCGSGPCSVQNPLNVNSLCGFLKKVLEAVITIAIPIAVVFIIWAGFKFVLAQGNSTELKKARSNFLYTVIGIAVFLGAWLLVQVIALTLKELGVVTVITCT